MCYFMYVFSSALPNLYLYKFVQRSWLIQFPFMFVSPQKIRHLFTAKACIAPIAWLSIFIWAMVKVPPSISLEPKQTSLHGSAYSWAWLSAMNSALGTYASLAVKIPDFTVSHYLVVVSSPILKIINSDMRRLNEREYGRRSLAWYADLAFIAANSHKWQLSRPCSRLQDSWELR